MLSRVRLDDIGDTIALGPDPQVHLDAVARFATAGYNEIYLHQIGPNQAEFLRFCDQHLLPALRGRR